MPTFDDAQSALEQHFSFASFREGQADVIRAVLEGRDSVVVMPTGGGKSLCYQLPALLFPGTTLVVSPLIALMKDQVDALNARGIAATVINSSISFDEQLSRIRLMAEGFFKLVYVAPERFRNERFVEALKQVTISLFAVDEAHCISQWGHDFRPDYLRLRAAVEALSQGSQDSKRPQIIALTATATPTVRADIGVQLGVEDAASFVAGFDRPNLALRVVPCKTDRERIAHAAQIIERSDGTGIIYASTRKAVEEVTSQLQRLQLKVAAYHAGLSEDVRSKVQDRFMSGELQAIVATNAFGMGIDKRDLRFVTHYNLPGSIEAYYQEVGRAGRDGLPSVCTLLFNYIDTRTHEFFIDGSYPDPDLIREVYAAVIGTGSEMVELTAREIAPRIGIRNEMAINSALVYLEKAGHIERGQAMNSGIRVIDRVARQAVRVDWNDVAKRRAAEERKLREMVNYAYHEECLRRFILKYFGDRKQAANCRCSNCQPKLKWKEIEEAVEAINDRAQRNAANALNQTTGPRPLTDEEHLAARKILSCVARMDGKFGKSTVAGVLRGSRAKNIAANRLDQLSTYGLLREYSQDELTRFLNALIVAGCIRQGGGARPVVSLTELGRQMMHDRVRVELDLEGVAADFSDEAGAEEVSEEAERAGIERQIASRPGDTHEKTFKLYQQGLRVNEIAAERELATSTIETHLAILIADGRSINLDRLVAPADRALIEAAIDRCRQAGQTGLSPIKSELPEHISYGAIRFAIAARGKTAERP